MDSIVESATENEENKNSNVTQATEESNLNSGRMEDEELLDVVEDLETKVTVVGCGGGGNNTLNRMHEEGVHGANMIAINTDAQHLVNTHADEKILIGQEATGGRGAGSVPKVGQESAIENQDEIRESIDGSDMVFVTAGMGGGTGTGAAPIVAETARETGALTISIVTTPFTAEGEVRKTNAEAGLEQLRQVSDTVIVVPNDRLLETVSDLPVQKAFKVADEVLFRAVKGITEMITKPGLVNLDFADVRTIMENGGVAMIGMGESSSANKAEDSIRSALSSPLLDIDISNASAALVNVTGGPNMSIDEAEGVVEDLHERLDSSARIIWGTSINDEIEGEMRSMLVVTGVQSEQIYGSVTTENQPESAENTEEEEDESSIDFVV